MDKNKPEKVLYKESLLQSVSRWRSIAFVLFAILLVISRYVDVNEVKEVNSGPHEKFIARVLIYGEIAEDRKREQELKKIRDNDKIAAVVVHIDSPGGTVVGGEVLYSNLKDIASKKPVVAVMGTIAASGGYMAALAADHIIAHQGTITGSIGVVTNAMEVTELMDKLGIKSTQIKSGALKNALSPFDKLSEGAKANVESMVNDAFNYFLSLVQTNRSLSKEDALARSDGRLYTGSQALRASLIDQIGGEEEALLWLENKKIKFPVRTVPLYPRRIGLEKIVEGLSWADLLNRLTIKLLVKI